MKPSSELTRGQKAAIQSIEAVSNTVVSKEGESRTTSQLRFKLYPKEGPLTKLGEKYGLFPKEVEGGTTNIQINNYQRGNDPIDISSLQPEEQAQFLAYLSKVIPKAIEGGK